MEWAFDKTFLKSEHLDLSKGSFVAFALWDGGKKNRDGVKLLTSWVGVEASKLVYLDELQGGIFIMVRRLCWKTARHVISIKQ